MTGGWTKYGGRRYSVIDNQKTILDENWVCQCCALTYPPIMSPYKFEYPEGEYISVCAVCLAEGCMRLMERIAQEIFEFDAES